MGATEGKASRCVSDPLYLIRGITGCASEARLLVAYWSLFSCKFRTKDIFEKRRGELQLRLEVELQVAY